MKIIAKKFRSDEYHPKTQRFFQFFPRKNASFRVKFSRGAIAPRTPNFMKILNEQIGTKLPNRGMRSEPRETLGTFSCLNRWMARTAGCI